MSRVKKQTDKPTNKTNLLWRPGPENIEFCQIFYFLHDISSIYLSPLKIDLHECLETLPVNPESFCRGKV